MCTDDIQLTATMFKESADEAFKSKNYRNAIGVRYAFLLLD